jgi:polyribonucleotide nucleotidyltransferase
MAFVQVEREIAGRTMTIETGKWAKQAAGAAVVRYGDTVVLSTVVNGVSDRVIDFFPLYVDYREKTSAAGKFPGGFIKREGRPTTKEILTMRMIDRPMRPLFPKGFRQEVQIQAMVLSADQQNDPDILAVIASSAALAVSELPFGGTVGAVRVAYVNDELVFNPDHAQLEFATMELVLAGTKAHVNMIELGASPTSEEKVLAAMKGGHEVIQQVCEMIDELAAKASPKKMTFEIAPEYNTFLAKFHSDYTQRMREAKAIVGKLERKAAVDAIRKEAVGAVAVSDDPKVLAELTVLAKMAMEEFEEKVVRQLILEGKRSDGRAIDELRAISAETSVLPRTHGSAVFTRGETQALVVATLGTTDDEQVVDGLSEEYSKKFMLDYNFPPFSVGEVKPIRGPGRREYGHGALAERCLANVMPSVEVFPYTVRLVSDVLESNGSSSMATTCGGTLALMDAGVPIKAPVAGISIGLVKEGDKELLLTDIIGEEDHFGDMDFKVAGTTEGITGIQLDLKIDGLPFHIIEQAFERARTTRLQLLEIMQGVLPTHRSEISPYAPRLLTVRIDPSKIGAVIGPGGKVIRKIQEETGATIEIEDDGTVYISSTLGGGAEAAKAYIEKLTEEVEVGKTYTGRITGMKEFGVFVEILPGQEGMCHISELSNEYVSAVEDVVKMGEELTVKVLSIDDQGKIKLSKRALEPGYEPREDTGRSGGRGGDRGGRGGRGGDRRGGDRGGRR